MANCSGMKPESAAEERNLHNAFNKLNRYFYKTQLSSTLFLDIQAYAMLYRVTHLVEDNLLLTLK